MTKRNTIHKWIAPVVTALALTGFASLCQAQPTIVLSNDSSQSTAFYDGGPAGATYTWQATGGPNGGGCIKGVIDGTTTLELDPAWNVSFSSGQYFQATVQMMVDPGSGVINGGIGGYGNIQLSFRDAGFSWNGVGYHTIYPPAANEWVTYTFSVPGPSFNVAHLQLQLQAGSAYSGPVTIYIGNVTISPVPNPLLISAFTNDVVSASWNNNGTTMNASWDGNIDSPYSNVVTHAAPVSLTPAGSVMFTAPIETNYPGGQLNLGFNPSLFQFVDFDLYYDGPQNPTSTNYAGFQMFIANGVSPYNWAFIGAANFNAGMIGKWTHYSFPSAATGIVNANGFAIQATPGSNGTNAIDQISFHIDNIQVWSPVTLPMITSVTKGTPGGVQITLDGNGTQNIYDQEGITSPSTNNSSVDYFWINQTPATYAFTLTNFPSPASAPQFDAHIYLDNGYSIDAFNSAYGYNQTYSGSPYNMVDYLGLHVQNGTNGGVVAVVDWKTNAPNSNATNMITFNFPTMKSGNGTWMLTFSDNTHGSVIAADGSVNNFTLPDFVSDPNYSGSFTPINPESMVQFGVFKNGNTNNNDKSFTLVSIGVTNASTTLADNFSGPGLTANNNWQVAEYYQFAANRSIWQPAGTAYWLKWNTASSGWSVQASGSLSSGWTNAGVTYTYKDATGTNTLGAVPATNLPAGNNGFFRLVK
jgi:hypothetical protein